MRRGFIGYFTRHPTAANLLLVVMLVAGITTAPNMRAQFFPDVVSDEVSISVRWEGAGAEDVDRAIVQVIEPALMVVDGVADSRATSSEGRASITLEFEPGWDPARAAEDVQAALDQVTNLPEDADEPNVIRGGWRDRVTDVVITGPVGIDQLARYTDEFVTRLFAAGITRTTIRGVADPEILIEVPMASLLRHDVTMAQISAAIAEEVTADPAGDVSGANARVRTGVEKRSADQIAAIVIRSNSDGSTLTVADVATVRAEGIDRDRAYFVGPNSAMSVRVDRSDSGDAIKMQHAVQKVADEMEATLPAGTSVELIRTRAEAITGRLNILLDNGLQGLVLVVLLLFLFLNARTAIWVAAGIPVSMLSAIAVMYAAGMSLNMISLFALIITLGIVVDDAIVVGEHADFRSRTLGEKPVQAAETAARRMLMPVTASTITTVIAFAGLTFIGGRFGDMIGDIPLTVIAVLLASLVECFFILPNHMAHALVHSGKDHWYDMPSRVVNRGLDWFSKTLFRPFIGFVIRARYPVIAGAMLLLATQAALFIRGDVPWRFFNSPEQGSVTGNFAMLPGATREDSIAMMRELQRATEDVAKEYEAKHGTNPLVFVLAEVGGNSGMPLPGADTKDADLLGGIAIELIDADLRPYSSFAFVAELQDRVRQHPMVETLSFRGWRSGPGGSALDVQFFGADASTLKAAAEVLKVAVSRFPEVSAVEDNLAYDKEELVLDLTPQGQALGFTIDNVGRSLRAMLNGIEAATYPDGPRSATVRVELPRNELTADFLERLQMRTPQGAYVPLSDIVTVRSQAGFSTVRRENGLRTVSVTGDVSEDDPARAEAFQLALETEILPKIAEENQVEYRLAGLSEQENEFLGDAGTGLILCLTGIYLVLAWVFSSWTRPIVVMLIIPFGAIGMIWGHHIWSVPLSMFTVVGFMGMVGIIINDSIVLISTIDEYSRERGLVPAIIDGVADRLRPVMLTTATTVLGLAPLLYETSQQAQFLRPTVITLVYGLGFGMVLVLMVVPAVLSAQADFARMQKAFRRAIATPRTGELRLALGGASLLLLVWVALTMGWAAITGSVHPVFSGLAGAGMGGAFALFAAGAAALVFALYATLAIRQARRNRRAA